MFSEPTGPQSPPVTMEARKFWLLVMVLPLVSSSSTGQYVGLCEYRSDLLPLSRKEEGPGGGVGAHDEGTGRGRARLGASCGLRRVTRSLNNLIIATYQTHTFSLNSSTNWVLLSPFYRQGN